MTEGFVNISVERRSTGYHVVMDAGNGKRTVSRPFRTAHAANHRAEIALRELMSMHPEAELSGEPE